MRGSDISAECKSVDIRASNADRPCTHRQCLDHIGPRTHAGIEQDGRVAGCGYYRRQHVNCSPFLHSLDVRHDWNSRSHPPRNQSHDAHRRDGICLSRSAATLLLTSTRACLPTLILFRTLHTKAVPRPWCRLLQPCPTSSEKLGPMCSWPAHGRVSWGKFALARSRGRQPVSHASKLTTIPLKPAASARWIRLSANALSLGQ